MSIESTGETTVEDNSESNQAIEKPGEVAPEEVVEDKPLVKVELITMEGW